MKFRFYDILSHLIPGAVLYLAYLNVVGEKFEEELIFQGTVISFLAGYFVNTISSWLEGIYFWTWNGKPSDRLLEGKDIWKVRFYSWREVRKELEKECEIKKAKNSQLFEIAMRYQGENTRIVYFNENYAFSRAILTTVLVTTFTLILTERSNYFLISVSSVATIVAWLRCKQRGYYYAREILSNYIAIKREK